MKSGITWCVVVAAFAAGLGLGFVVSDDRAEATSSRAKPAAELAASRQRDTEPQQNVHVPNPGLRAALDSIEIPEPIRGEGQVTGQVVDANGKPIAGARILAQPSQTRTRRKRSRAPREPGLFDAEAYVSRTVKNQVRAERSRRWGTSGADGKFVIEGIADVNYGVWCYLDGYECVGKSSYRVRPGADLRFVAKPLARVPVEVVVIDEGAPKNAVVEIESNGRTFLDPWTPADPWFETPPGRYTVSATVRRGEETGRSASQDLVIEAGRTPRSMRFEIRLASTLRITVKTPVDFDSGQPQVSLQRLDAEGKPVSLKLSAFQKTPRGNNVTYTGLKPGRYRVRASVFERGEWEEFDLGAGVTDRTVVAPAPDPTKSLIVRVIAPDGSALEGVRLSSVAKSKRGTSSGGGSVLTRRGDGVHFVAVRKPNKAESAADMTYFVEASHPEFGTVRGVVDVSATTPVDLQFARAGRVTLVFDGVAKIEFREQLRVSVHRADPSEIVILQRRENSSLTAEGKIDLGLRQPGEYRYAVWRRSGPFDAVFLGSQSFRVVPGEREIRTKLPALYSLRVHWSGRESTQIRLRPHRIQQPIVIVSDGWELPVDAGTTGTIRFVPAGVYRLSANGIKSITIKIPAQTEVTLP